MLVTLFGCAGRRPGDLGVRGARLAPCPSRPNCVSSDAPDAGHRVGAFALAVEPARAWQAVREAVAELPRTRVVTATDDYLHAECRSALLGFVDDLELHLRPAEAVVALRSASRVGYSDLGVNRRRIQALRQVLRERGIIR